ncbi:hypothetical protein CFLV_09605 [Corynebacterium flavescens]|nr:hypothetical protein CFLV_09605 [Corynebacterium flavescens]
MWDGEWTDSGDYFTKLKQAQDDAALFPDCYQTRIAQREVGPIVPLDDDGRIMLGWGPNTDLGVQDSIRITLHVDDKVASDDT